MSFRERSCNGHKSAIFCLFRAEISPLRNACSGVVGLLKLLGRNTLLVFDFGRGIAARNAAPSPGSCAFFTCVNFGAVDEKCCARILRD